MWLNEAMATFLQFKAMHAAYPEMDLVLLLFLTKKLENNKNNLSEKRSKEDQFISNTLVPVMYDDGYASSHPVSVDVLNPDEISALFSSITYDKGSSLLFMLESTVNETNFRDGLRVFILIVESDESILIFFAFLF